MEEFPPKPRLLVLKDPGLVVSRILETTAFQFFFTKISQAGFLLFACAIIAFVWSNVDAVGYTHFWHTQFTVSLGSLAMSHSLAHWINDGLMTIFFLTVGLEIKREMLVGGLSDPRRAALPVAAAIGGMVVPALIYLFFNFGQEGSSGWGIPMATDIAFSLAVLSVVGKGIPFGVRLFLTAFAIADDLGAIVVIALFYTPAINLQALLVAILLSVGLLLLNRFGVRHNLPYILICILLWFAFGQAGLHPTVAGVITAMFIPSTGRYDTDKFLSMVNRKLDALDCQDGSCGQSIRVNRSHLQTVQEIKHACSEVETPLQRLEHSLSSWVGYLVLPLFALANAGVALAGLELGTALVHPITVGVAFGLMVGKPLGILVFTYLATKVLKTRLLKGTTWGHILGAGFLGGIGFTMSLFISALSFTNPVFQEYAKIGIIIATVISGLAGYAVLRFSIRQSTGRH